METLSTWQSYLRIIWLQIKWSFKRSGLSLGGGGGQKILLLIMPEKYYTINYQFVILFKNSSGPAGTLLLVSQWGPERLYLVPEPLLLLAVYRPTFSISVSVVNNTRHIDIINR